MSKAILVIVAASLLFFGQVQGVSAKPEGKPCNHLGSTKIVSGSKYKCKKVKKATKWVFVKKCDTRYYGACVPITTKDLDCSDIGEKVFVKDPDVDPHNLDSDGDGKGCEQ